MRGRCWPPPRRAGAAALLSGRGSSMPRDPPGAVPNALACRSAGPIGVAHNFAVRVRKLSAPLLHQLFDVALSVGVTSVAALAALRSNGGRGILDDGEDGERHVESLCPARLRAVGPVRTLCCRRRTPRFVAPIAVPASSVGGATIRGCPPMGRGRRPDRSERCNTDRATEPMSAPPNLPRPWVARHTTHEPSVSARRAITSAGSPLVTTDTRSSPSGTPSAAEARRRARSASSSPSATVTVCKSAPKRCASTRAVGIAWRASSDPSNGTSTFLMSTTGRDGFASGVTRPAWPVGTTLLNETPRAAS